MSEDCAKEEGREQQRQGRGQTKREGEEKKRKRVGEKKMREERGRRKRNKKQAPCHQFPPDSAHTLPLCKSEARRIRSGQNRLLYETK